MKKLIIEIEECDYEVIKRECSNKDVVPIGWVQILNGTPLPKGHGRLIDADKINFDSNYFYDGDDTIIAEETINDMPTIIEADKAESEDKE